MVLKQPSLARSARMERIAIRDRPTRIPLRSMRATRSSMLRELGDFLGTVDERLRVVGLGEEGLKLRTRQRIEIEAKLSDFVEEFLILHHCHESGAQFLDPVLREAGRRGERTADLRR